MAQTNKTFSAIGSARLDLSNMNIYPAISAFWLYNFAPFKTRRAKLVKLFVCKICWPWDKIRNLILITQPQLGLLDCFIDIDVQFDRAICCFYSYSVVSK